VVWRGDGTGNNSRRNTVILSEHSFDGVWWRRIEPKNSYGTDMNGSKWDGLDKIR
jgi:hypothetical protein